MSLSRWIRTPLLVLPLVLFLWPGTPVQASTARESILANGMKVLLVEVLRETPSMVAVHNVPGTLEQTAKPM